MIFNIIILQHSILSGSVKTNLSFSELSRVPAWYTQKAWCQGLLCPWWDGGMDDGSIFSSIEAVNTSRLFRMTPLGLLSVCLMVAFVITGEGQERERWDMRSLLCAGEFSLCRAYRMVGLRPTYDSGPGYSRLYNALLQTPGYQWVSPRIINPNWKCRCCLAEGDVKCSNRKEW